MEVVGINLISAVILLVVGFGAGVWWHRYMLKRNPEKLRILSEQAKALGSKIL